MYLDPAHMPSPRMLHALKMGQVPLTVVNDEREDESWWVWLGLLRVTILIFVSFVLQRGHILIWISRATFIANHPDRGLSDKQSTSGPGNVSSTRSVTGTMSFTEAIHNREWSRGNSFVEQIGSHRIEFERSWVERFHWETSKNWNKLCFYSRSTCCGYDRIILYFFCLVSALVLSVVPSLYLANYIMGTETLLSFDIIVTHTFVTLSIWWERSKLWNKLYEFCLRIMKNCFNFRGVSIMLAFFLILAIYSIIASCRNCYRRRKASLEEAVLVSNRAKLVWNFK